MWNAIRIWTRVVVSTSCDDNHYTTGTSTITVIIQSLISTYFSTVCWFVPGISPLGIWLAWWAVKKEEKGNLYYQIFYRKTNWKIRKSQTRIKWTKIAKKQNKKKTTKNNQPSKQTKKKINKKNKHKGNKKKDPPQKKHKKKQSQTKNKTKQTKITIKNNNKKQQTS